MLWTAGVLVLCLVLFMVISRYMSYDLFREDGPLADLVETQFEDAMLAYERGGAEDLHDYLTHLGQSYPQNEYYMLVDGKYPKTGEDLADLRRMADSWWERLHVGAPRVIRRSSADGHYVYLMIFAAFGSNLRIYAAYYLVLMAAIAVLGWVLMFQFAGPLNELTEAVHRFGHGELTARVKQARKDGIGELGEAFNQMADRIQTFVSAERQLLQDISHELRSPLARLSVAAELTRNAAERDAAVSQIHKEVDRLTELLEGLIQITRAESDPAAQKLGHVALDELVREVIDDCAIEANSRGCKLQLSGAARISLEADRELLRRAVENLLRNAIRYSPADSNIEINVGGTDSNASITVRDYGPGVPAAALNHIFDPFFRVDNSRDMATGGIGLGLSITQRAIHLHHGQIRAENADPGLRVCMELPLRA
jgi:two-component system sensor histidine kinase CpxA